MTILTAYISALTMSNQALAQHQTATGVVPIQALNNVNVPANLGCALGGTARVQSVQNDACFAGQPAQLGQTLAGQEAHVGKVLGGHELQSLLGMKAFVVLETSAGEHQTGQRP
jgi:hypothetical protein